jgi:hypothetical protein
MRAGIAASTFALAKRKPDEIHCGASRLSVPHMTGEYLNARTTARWRNQCRQPAG